MTEHCHEGEHARCAGRTVDGWRCGCQCHEEETE